MNVQFLNTNLLTALAIGILTTGCATVVNDTTQPMRIDTLTADGKEITGAECKVDNDRGAWSLKSGEVGNVRRSSKDLNIVCTDPQNPEAKARAVSRANVGMFGNILLGGAVGAVIDHNRGTAYTYPTWMKLQFGKTLVFDRHTQKDEGPMEGLSEPATTAAK
jgi:hypothetical protein